MRSSVIPPTPTLSSIVSSTTLTGSNLPARACAAPRKSKPERLDQPSSTVTKIHRSAKLATRAALFRYTRAASSESARPPRRNLLHPAVVAGNPRDRSFQHRLVLEEIQMTPLLLPDVVDAASLGAAGRTGEPAAPREADVQIELFLVGVEFGSQHDPRGRQPQRRLEKLSVSHLPQLRDSPIRQTTKPTGCASHPHKTAMSPLCFKSASFTVVLPQEICDLGRAGQAPA